MTLLRGRRAPNAEVVVSLLMWWLTFANIIGCFVGLERRYHTLAEIQQARMGCEARGGFYGAAHGGEDRCVEGRTNVTR